MNLRRLTSLYIASKNTELSANLQFICESDGIDVSEHRYLNILYLCTQEFCLNFPCIPSLPTVCTYESYKIKNMLSEVCMETVFPCSIQSFNREAGFLKKPEMILKRHRNVFKTCLHYFQLPVSTWDEFSLAVTLHWMKKAGAAKNISLSGCNVASEGQCEHPDVP